MCVFVTIEGNRHAPLHPDITLLCHRGLRLKLGSELVPGSDSSISYTNFSSRAFLWATEGPQASYVSMFLNNEVIDREVFANIQNMRLVGLEASTETRLEKLVWQIEMPAPVSNSEPSLWRSPL
jgi:hypothetical protein